MNREILFRGKRWDNGEWVMGDLVELQNETLIHYWVSGCRASKSVNPSTVGQYTGLTDKNGKRIFEGDIVRYGDTTHKVVFETRNGTAYFGLVYAPEETLPFGHYQDLRQIEKIGNVFDNPELLEDPTP